MIETIKCESYEELSEKASKKIIERIISHTEKFSMAIPGGNSVKGVLELLGKSTTNWENVKVFMTDERMVPLTSKESNYNQANKLFFLNAKKLESHTFESEKGISYYNKVFEEVTNSKLDLVVLGVGEDGHVASLFPNHESVKNNSIGFIEINNAPKAPNKRISLSRRSIEEAETVMLLFASSGKEDAYTKFIDEKLSYIDCPAKIGMKSNNIVILTFFGDKNAE